MRGSVKDDFLKIDGLFRDPSSDGETSKSKVSSPSRLRKGTKRKKSQVNRKAHDRVSDENEQLKLAMAQL